MAHQEIRSLPKIGILIRSRRAPNATAAASSPPTTHTGKGDMAMPKVASVEMIRTSATEDETSHTEGRSPHKCCRSRRA